MLLGPTDLNPEEPIWSRIFLQAMYFITRSTRSHTCGQLGQATRILRRRIVHHGPVPTSRQVSPRIKNRHPGQATGTQRGAISAQRLSTMRSETKRPETMAVGMPVPGCVLAPTKYRFR